MGIFQMKLRARAALKNHWQTALLIALIVNLPTLLIEGISSSTGNDLSSIVLGPLVDSLYSDSAIIGGDQLLSQLNIGPIGAGVWVMQGLSLLAWLILTPCLELGMTHWTLDRLRGAEEPVATVFSRVRIFVKSIGLRLAVSLRVLLWALPGLAVCGLALVLMLNVKAPAASEDLLSVYSLSSLTFMLFLMGLAGMAVLGFLSWLRFSQATLIMADEPEESIGACMSRSRQMMGRRKGSFIGLIASYIPLLLIINFAASIPDMIFGGNLGGVLYFMLQMLGTMAISVSVLAGRGAFYENLREMQAKAPVEAEGGSVAEAAEDSAPGETSDSASNDSSDAD